MNARILLGIIGSAVLAISCAQSDPGITTSVKTQLAADELVKARQINVDTKDRVVTLTGTVERADEEAKAIEIARKTTGVVDVVDNIAVATRGEPGTTATSGRAGDPATPDTAAATDAGITGMVKSNLLADPDVAGLKIDVDTRDKVVTLTGTVKTEAEKARAIELARKVESVTRVEDRLTVGARTP
jgi:hyperosmotically inducible periplasmic protein